MKERGGGGRPQGELTTERGIVRQELAGNRQDRQDGAESSFLPDKKRGWPGRTHEELVEGFRDFLSFWQDRLYRDHGMRFSPAQIIRNKLHLYKDLTDDYTRAFVTPLAMAWNVLIHDHYEFETLTY